MPSEDKLSGLLLDQKDSLYYAMQVIPDGASSSLCGPTTAVNWLQLLTEDSYAKSNLVSLVAEVGADLRAQNIEINSGLTEPQLVTFLSSLGARVGWTAEFNFISRSKLPIEKIWENKIQILMLNYAEPVRRGPIRRDDYINSRPPLRGNHFVLKVYADEANSQIWLIDPENPGVYTKVQVEDLSKDGVSDIRLRPASPGALSSFAFGVPLTWSATGVIETN